MAKKSIMVNIVGDVLENDTIYDVLFTRETRCRKMYIVQKNYGNDNSDLKSFVTQFRALEDMDKTDVKDIITRFN